MHSCHVWGGEDPHDVIEHVRGSRSSVCGAIS
jgi:hypothetical protein